MKFFVFSLILSPALAFAHVHGVGSVSIAFDGNIGKVELTAPADSIVGFEKAPKTEAQKKKQAAALEKLSSKIADMVAFESGLACAFVQDHVEMKAGEHGDVDGSWNVTCARNPIGTKITFEFQKFFPALRKVEIIALIGGLQKSLNAEKDGATLILR